ncbi:MAG TPA: hypothetical protein VF035_08385 [Longimicrobiales bacterium]
MPRHLWIPIAGVAAALTALTAAAAAMARQSPDPPSASAAILGMLEDGAVKRQLIGDCTGCHQLAPANVFPGGRTRTAAEWTAVVQRMQAFAGHGSGFPVIGVRDAAATGAWLAANLDGSIPSVSRPPARADMQIREYPYPYDRDLPHDLAVLGDGSLAITGMLTNQMLVLDPTDGSYDEIPIPVERANPRAIEVDDGGNWWVVLGAPNQLARYEPAIDHWTTWDLGMYAHEARPDNRGRVWFNGHFTSNPVKVGYLDIASGAIRTFDVPTPQPLAEGGAIPYGLAVGRDGTLWGSDLRGNRIYAVDAQGGAVRTWDMPTTHSSPRRIDLDHRGVLWIPEYANNTLTSFDPASGRFTQYPLPIPDALPYVVRADSARDIIWIGTGAADAVLAFRPASAAFDVYPLPTAGALVRHIAIDPHTRDVWAAYGASPGIPPKIARLRLVAP